MSRLMARKVVEVICLTIGVGGVGCLVLSKRTLSSLVSAFASGRIPSSSLLGLMHSRYIACLATKTRFYRAATSQACSLLFVSRGQACSTYLQWGQRCLNEERCITWILTEPKEIHASLNVHSRNTEGANHAIQNIQRRQCNHLSAVGVDKPIATPWRIAQVSIPFKSYSHHRCPLLWCKRTSWPNEIPSATNCRLSKHTTPQVARYQPKQAVYFGHFFQPRPWPLSFHCLIISPIPSIAFCL